MSNNFSFGDLLGPVSRAEAQQAIYDALGIVGINPTSWKPGGVVRTMIACTAAVLSGLSEVQAMVARAGFLEFAESEWLTLTARYVYGVERINATFASGDLVLTNGAGGVFRFDPGDLIFKNSVTGATYRNTSAFSLGAGPATSVTIPIQATEAGSESSSDPEDIDAFVTTVIGVTCSSPAQLIGTDEETDPALRARCQEKLGSLSPFGPWDAYAFAVRSATFPDGTSIGATRVRVAPDGFGGVGVWVAGAGGTLGGG